MSLLDKANAAKASADNAKGQIADLKAQLVGKDAVIADLQSQLAEVPAVADLLDQIKAELG